MDKNYTTTYSFSIREDVKRGWQLRGESVAGRDVSRGGRMKMRVMREEAEKRGRKGMHRGEEDERTRILLRTNLRQTL